MLKCMIDPDVPVNSGFYRNVHMIAPAGSVVNCTAPAPVVGGWETQLRLTEVMLKALADAIPEKVPAGTEGMICHSGFGGFDPYRNETYCFLETIAGGFGARATSDGPDAVQPHGKNTANAPIEETELNYPVRITRYELVENSEGPGRYRGGLGLRRDYLFPDHQASFTILADRERWGPHGLFGGHSGEPAHYVLNPDSDAQNAQLPSKVTVQLSENDVVSYRTCGGGGYGPPEQRDPEDVLRDVRDGRVSPNRARDIYRVAINTEAWTVDDDATATLRSAVSGQRESDPVTDQYRLGIDIGGTFTDGILLNETTGEIRTAKVPSTPADPSDGFLHVLRRMLDDGQAEPDAVKYVVHGTTVATNAIIEGNLAKTAFITTEGFRDLLEIQTGIRPTLYDLQFQKLKPLVPRYLCFGVPERLDYRGEVLVPLDEDAVKERGSGVARRRRGVRSGLPPPFVHQPGTRATDRRNPRHRIAVSLCSLSSEVAPEFREYFRASTTVINAAIRPVVSSYLGNIQASRASIGSHGRDARDAEQRGSSHVRSSDGSPRLHGRVRTRRRCHSRIATWRNPWT